MDAVKKRKIPCSYWESNPNPLAVQPVSHNYTEMSYALLPRANSKAKVKFPLYLLLKHYAMKKCGGVEAWHHHS
jgi:hypothetical protein